MVKCVNVHRGVAYKITVQGTMVTVQKAAGVEEIGSLRYERPGDLVRRVRQDARGLVEQWILSGGRC